MTKKRTRKLQVICLRIACDAGEDAALKIKPRNVNPYKNPSLQAWWDLGWLSVLDCEKGMEYDA